MFLCGHKSFPRRKKTWERGRVQIWNQRQLERPAPAYPNSPDSWKQRRSVATGSSTAPSVTRSFSTAYTSPVETMGSSSVSFQMPGLPILVFYLAPSASNSEELSFLRIQSDLAPFEESTTYADDSQWIRILKSRPILANAVPR